VARPVALPAGASVIGIGGATLGGAGKSPLAVALARELALRGGRVAIVSHAYRAAPGRARVVRPSDDVASVGDDALCTARLAAQGGVEVVVAPSRARAVAHAAARGARVIVVDGLLQATPARLAASVLVLDAGSPWGAGACPPRGDLRAPASALLEAADVVAVVRDGGAALDPSTPRGAIDVPSDLAGAVDAGGDHLDLAALARLRVGLVLAIARPDRVVRALARRGITPAAVVTAADHARLGPAFAARLDARVDAWLTTARCATKLPASARGRPVLALDHRLDARALVGALAARLGPFGHAAPL
jgi:tetraacyldisaccharide 4'-kinase